MTWTINTTSPADKLCAKCQLKLPLEAFETKFARGKPYVRGTCKACMLVYFQVRSRLLALNGSSAITEDLEAKRRRHEERLDLIKERHRRLVELREEVA